MTAEEFLKYALDITTEDVSVNYNNIALLMQRYAEHYHTRELGTNDLFVETAKLSREVVEERILRIIEDLSWTEKKTGFKACYTDVLIEKIKE